MEGKKEEKDGSMNRRKEKSKKGKNGGSKVGM